MSWSHRLMISTLGSSNYKYFSLPTSGVSRAFFRLMAIKLMEEDLYPISSSVMWRALPDGI